MTIEIKHATLKGRDEALARRLNGRTATMRGAVLYRAMDERRAIKAFLTL